MKKQIKELTKAAALITYLESLKDAEKKIESGEYDPRRIMLILVKSFIKIIENAVKREAKKHEDSKKQKKKIGGMYS